jgi:hypothetical protein
MERSMTSRYPFEVPYEELVAHIDDYVDRVFSALRSEFLSLPKGEGFIEYPVFEDGYEALKRSTHGFVVLTIDAVMEAIREKPVALIVLRAILGLSPPEWAYLATQHTNTEVRQGFSRSLDRRIRLNPTSALAITVRTSQRVRALVETACDLLAQSCPDPGPDDIHRLGKADTAQGIHSMQRLADIGVPYAMLLYERFLGRPFASHRDSVSELVGGLLEADIEEQLIAHGISYRRTGRAERIGGFDQAPDFCIPSEYNPQIVIEAKITEDDGTARDKITRIQHLAELARACEARGVPSFEVIACIGGRGFGVRREDMKKLLLATKGRVFTRDHLIDMIDRTRLCEFVTKPRAYR